MTPDPYQSSGGPSDPQSWNRYAYVRGDPIKFQDPRGLNMRNPDDPICGPDGCICDPTMDDCDGGGGGPVDPPPPPIIIEEDSFRPADNARLDLGKKPCYTLLGFATAELARKWFDSQISKPHYDHYGRLHMQSPGIPAGEPWPAPANTVGFGQININVDYNWDDFSKVTTDTGRSENYLRDINNLLNTNMTSDQLGTLIYIHELGHQLTVPKAVSDVESAAEKRKIYDACIK